MTMFYKSVKWKQTLENPHQQEHSNSLNIDSLCSILNSLTIRKVSLWKGLLTVAVEAK